MRASEIQREKRVVEVGEYHRTSDGRAAIGHGDLILFRDGKPVRDKLIELATHSPYCHSALAFLKSDDAGEKRVYIVQSTKRDGVNVQLLSTVLDTFEGAIEHWRVAPGPMEMYQPPPAVDFALAQRGKGFNYLALGPFTLDFLLGWAFRKGQLRSHSRSLATFFCSQLVAVAVKRGGVRLDPTHPFAATAPNDLVAHDRAEFVGALATRAVLEASKERPASSAAVT
jgi:hypothetical protein